MNDRVLDLVPNPMQRENVDDAFVMDPNRMMRIMVVDFENVEERSMENDEYKELNE